MDIRWTGLVASLKEMVVARNIEAMAFQFTILFLQTILLIYLVVLTTRSFTYIKSHFWIFTSTFLTTIMVSFFYYGYLWLKPNLFIAVIAASFYAGIVEAAVQKFDRGRSLVDIHADRKFLFQTDNRLIRRSAIFSLTNTIIVASIIISSGA